MKSKARSILEMALDLGDTPDWIDPEKRRKIEQGEHPYADNPAFPQEKPQPRPGVPYREQPEPNRQDPTRSYSELVSSHTYPEIIRKVQQYTGQNPRRLQPQQLIMMMQQALMHAFRAEQPHRARLEQAAVEVVLSLPEFRDAQAAIEGGALRIEAHLVNPAEMMEIGQRRLPGEEEPPAEEPEEEPAMFSGRGVEAPEETEDEKAELGLNVPQIRGEFDVEANKRRFVNMLIQGAAVNKNFAYHQIADELRAIDPDILQSYGKAMSIAELMYWAMPEQVANDMMGGGGGAGGMEEIEQEDDGVWVVRAYGIIFPVLIQEIVKGLYEFLAHNEDEPEDVRKYSYNKADTLGNEQWDIMKGPGVWRHINYLVNQADGAEYMGRIFRHLATLPAGEFNDIMQHILKETPEGRAYIRNLVAEIRAEAEGQQESLARKFIRDERAE